MICVRFTYDTPGTAGSRVAKTDRTLGSVLDWSRRPTIVHDRRIDGEANSLEELSAPGNRKKRGGKMNLSPWRVAWEREDLEGRGFDAFFRVSGAIAGTERLSLRH